MTGFGLSPKEKPDPSGPAYAGAPDGACQAGVSGQLLIDEGCELRLAHGADFRGRQLAALENHQGRDAADAEFGRDVTVVVHIHLGDLKFALVSVGDFVQNRRDHFARATPLGPKVDHHRLAGLEHIGFKCGVGNVFDQIAGHGLFLVNNEDTAKVNAILTETGCSRAMSRTGLAPIR